MPWWTGRGAARGAHVSPSAQTEKCVRSRHGAAGLASQSQKSRASLGGTPSPWQAARGDAGGRMVAALDKQCA